MVNLKINNDQWNDENCAQMFCSRAIAMACFFYALCLNKGRGVQKNKVLSNELFLKVN